MGKGLKGEGRGRGVLGVKGRGLVGPSPGTKGFDGGDLQLGRCRHLQRPRQDD